MKLSVFLSAFWILVGGLPAVLLGQDGAPSGEAPSVVTVEVRSELPASRIPGLSSLVEIEPGEPLTEDRVRRTLRNLQASGRVAEAAVYRRPGPGGTGVVAVVVVWANLLVERIELTGNLGLGERALRGALEQRVGQPLSESRLLRGLYRLEDRLVQAGFFEGQARLQVARQGESDRVVVRYAIEAGPRTTIGEVRFVGTPPQEGSGVGPFSLRELIDALQARPGDPAQEPRLAEDGERLRRWLVEQGYRTATVAGPVRSEGSTPGSIDLLYTVDLGPPVEVEVVGAELKELRKEGLLPFLEEEGYESALLIRAKSRIRAYFQSKGFFFAEVSLREVVQEDLLKIVIEVQPGPKLRLAQVRFEGNESVPDHQLADLMATRPRSRIRPGGGRIVSEVLEEDLDNLRDFYALQGFRSAVVGEPVIAQEEETLILEIPIDEGPRRQVSSLKWTGTAAAPMDEWLMEAPLAEGGPYHPRLLEETLNGLRARFRAEGYDQVRVDSRVEIFNEDLVDVTITVDEGPQMLLDRLIVRGNLATKPQVIRRFVEIEPGQPVSRSRLLEVERRLSRLGIFSRVDVDISPGEIGGYDRDVVVRVEEGRARRLSYGFGYDSEDGVRGLLGYSHVNLGGRAVSLQMRARASETDNRFQLVLRQPYLGRWDLPVSYTLFSFDGDRETFEQTSVGLRIDSRKEVGFGNVGLAFDYRTVQLDNVEELIRLEPQDREIDVLSVIPSLLLDRRDDPFDPTDGWSSSVTLQHALPILSTDADFLKLFVQQTGYWSLGSAGVIAASVRGGAIESLGEPVTVDPQTGATINPVPIGERFFAGGRTSHRAFDRDLLGIDGETRITRLDEDGRVVELLPGGGNGLFLLNLEYRFPVVGALGGTVFADAGNVWADWRDFDSDELRYGVGLGLRYRSPIGPVRLEVGWNLDTLPGEDSAEVHLNFGNPF